MAARGTKCRSRHRNPSSPPHETAAADPAQDHEPRTFRPSGGAAGATDAMNSGLDLFTGMTWAECQSAGATVSGFRPRMKKTTDQVQPGDIFLSYRTG